MLYHLIDEALACFSASFCLISFFTTANNNKPRIVARAFTPTKLSQIPSNPSGQNAPNISIGKTNATHTDIIVANAGFSMALKNPCVVTTNHLKTYEKQNNCIAPVEIDSSLTSCAFANIDAMVDGKKKSR